MYAWANPESAPEEEPEVTWSEFTQLYLDLLKCVHVSEYDREERPIVYTVNVPSLPLAQLLISQYCCKARANGVSAQNDQSEDDESEYESDSEDEDDDDDQQDSSQEKTDNDEKEEEDLVPLTFLTCFFIHTHKGTDRLLARVCCCPSVHYPFISTRTTPDTLTQAHQHTSTLS